MITGFDIITLEETLLVHCYTRARFIRKRINVFYIIQIRFKTSRINTMFYVKLVTSSGILMSEAICELLNNI